MKEIKDFIKELNDCAILSDGGLNFQDHEIKSKHKFRRFEKSDINKVADFKYIPNPANGGDDDYIIADMVQNPSVMLMP